jgi:hypothetical protein
VNRQTDLPHVVLAAGATGGFASRLNGRQQQPHQHANDGDHNKQLHERKARCSARICPENAG